MPASNVGLIAQAVAEMAKVISNWQVSAERRRMQTAIEAGEKYIQVSKGEGPYRGLQEAKKTAYLRHFEKRFFKYNN